MQLDVSVKNAVLEALVATFGATSRIQLWTGVLPLNTLTPDPGVKIAEFILGTGAWNAAVAGQKLLANTPLQSGSLASGTVGYFRIVDSGNFVKLQGTVGQNGTQDGSGNPFDFYIDNPAITNGQTVSITAWGLTAPLGN